MIGKGTGVGTKNCIKLIDFARSASSLCLHVYYETQIITHERMVFENHLDYETNIGKNQ